jgi:serine phosphatase RsbU (regulator of sigma subunit)
MREFFERYTRDLTSGDVQRLFTRDTPEAYRFFARGIDADKLAGEPWYRRWAIHARLFFIAFTMRLSPARRALYGFAIVATLLGLIQLFDGFGTVRVLLWPFTIGVFSPRWIPGTMWIVLGFVAVNLVMLMEVADRLSLKGELEIARDIQLAMLPRGVQTIGDIGVCGITRPANTVGGDFYDILPLADGRLAIAVGDVAGKGSPAALLMALLLAILRTLVDEDIEATRLIARLNVQVARHSPSSRFITFFYGVYDPRDGGFEYVNAGHLPPLLRRASGAFERLPGNGLALGMFDLATFESHRTTIAAGDTLVLYSDGITEAENASGRAFEDTGLESVIADHAQSDPETLGRAVLSAVEAHAGDVRFGDDLTVLVLARRPEPSASA